MADKNVVMDMQFDNLLTLTDEVCALESLSGTQKSVLLMCARYALPCRVQVEQRTHKGTLDVRVNADLYKISPRAKLKRAYTWGDV